MKGSGPARGECAGAGRSPDGRKEKGPRTARPGGLGQGGERRSSRSPLARPSPTCPGRGRPDAPSAAPRLGAPASHPGALAGGAAPGAGGAGHAGSGAEGGGCGGKPSAYLSACVGRSHRSQTSHLRGGSRTAIPPRGARGVRLPGGHGTGGEPGKGAPRLRGAMAAPHLRGS